MSDMSIFGQFAILVLVSILAAYGFALLLLGSAAKRLSRVSVSAILATVFVHAYLVLAGQGVDQFVLISVVMMFVYGFLGSLFLDWLRTRFSRPAG